MVWRYSKGKIQLQGPPQNLQQPRQLIRMQLIVSLLLLVTAICATRVNVSLKRVVDGDTVDVAKVSEPDKKVRVRMRYIDAPESKQRFGKESTDFLKDVAGQPGQDLQLDVYKTDMYGRTIGEIYRNGENVNKMMVDNGYAWCYRMRCPASYKAGLELAREDKIGLFADSNPQTPWDYRKSKRKKKKKGPRPNLTTDEIIDAIPVVRSLTRNAMRIEVNLIRVSDGDTITVRAKETGDRMRIRFLFIDAPEKSQTAGKASKAFLKSLLEGSTKKLVIRAKETDRYGRTLGVVMLGRRDVNKLMLTNGWAWCYKTGCPSAYRRAMVAARQSGRGVWETDPQAPWDFRKYGARAKKQ